MHRCAANTYCRHNTPLTGKILINAFYEPSTRTRLSFDSAWHRLGGDSINITDRSTTGIAKGESLEDVAHMFNNYGDCVVLRDSNPEAVYAMTSTLRIPIINAGNGIDEVAAMFAATSLGVPSGSQHGLEPSVVRPWQVPHRPLE